jgi:predicted CoA-binding protein
MVQKSVQRLIYILIKSMKIALVENFGADFVGARLRLAIYLKSQGFTVSAIIPNDGHSEITESKGIRVIEVDGNIKAKGILVKLNVAKQLKLILKEENFDIVHFFRLQLNVIGTFVMVIPRILEHSTKIKYHVAFLQNIISNHDVFRVKYYFTVLVSLLLLRLFINYNSLYIIIICLFLAYRLFVLLALKYKFFERKK